MCMRKSHAARRQSRHTRRQTVRQPVRDGATWSMRPDKRVCIEKSELPSRALPGMHARPLVAAMHLEPFLLVAKRMNADRQPRVWTAWSLQQEITYVGT